MARIPEDVIERLKSEVDLVELVRAKGVELVRHGADLIGKCPFHEDKEPSLVVTPGKNLWHCLGACQQGGSVIDWVMKAEGLSFRHAVTLLQTDPTVAALSSRAVKVGTVRRLAAPFERDAGDDQVLLDVVRFYQETLKQSPEALAYLEKRGLVSTEIIDKFKLGYANRTLGYRLPQKNRQSGAELRGRLQKLGILRESGHEHFSGSLVIPVFDETGHVVEMYGRKINDHLRPGTPMHLYLPGGHHGVFNVEALAASEEIILCESLIDALSFWCAGFRNVTSSYGVEGFGQDHLEAFGRYKTQKVLIAYDRDEAGDRAADKISKTLVESGIDCFRIKFPHGMDANEYACKVQPAAKSLDLLVRKAEWVGNGVQVEPPCDEEKAAFEGGLIEAPAPAIEAPSTSAQTEPATISLPAPVCEHSLAAKELQKTPQKPDLADVQIKDDELVCRIDDRRWRVRGFAKNLSYEQLKVNVLVGAGERFHVDTLDLYAAKQRAVFAKQAAIELGASEGVIKADLGQVLLKLERLQEEQITKTLTPKSKEVALSDEKRAEAIELLKDPRLLDRVLVDFEKCGVVGEQTNKLVGYLAAVSRKLDEPLAIIVQSSSAAGKSSLMESILAFVPEEERTKYSAMTGQSLFYMGEADLKHKVLAIVEEEGAERASYALKLLQSEGELTIASTGKDPETGRLVTHEYRVEGPVMIFLTTTAIEVDEELLNRCIVLTVDEEREQTRKIHKLQRQRKTLDGLLANQDRVDVCKLHQNAQRLLRPLLVANPFAEKLTFLDDRTRTRRDHVKYLSLIQSIALLHQYQRPQKTINHHGRVVQYIEVTLDDISVANKLAHEVLGRSLDELPPQTRRMLTLLDQMVAEACKRSRVNRSDFKFSRREVREHTGWTEFQVRTHMNKLMELEYVLPHRGSRGLGFVYELVYDGQGKEGERFLMGLASVDDLKCNYDKNFEHRKPDFEHEKSQFEMTSSPQRAHFEVASSDEKSNADNVVAKNFELLPKRIYGVQKSPSSYVPIRHTDNSLAAAAKGC